MTIASSSNTVNKQAVSQEAVANKHIFGASPYVAGSRRLHVHVPLASQWLAHLHFRSSLFRDLCLQHRIHNRFCHISFNHEIVFVLRILIVLCLCEYLCGLVYVSIHLHLYDYKCKSV